MEWREKFTLPFLSSFKRGRELLCCIILKIKLIPFPSHLNSKHVNVMPSIPSILLELPNKYEEKVFVRKTKGSQPSFSVSQQMWESVRANNKKAVYRLVVSFGADVNARHQQVASTKSLIMPRVRNPDETPLVHDFDSVRSESVDRVASRLHSSRTGSRDPFVQVSLDECSLLHLACQFADLGMVELLLQYGADINASDYRGQTPLHCCIMSQKTDIAKMLLMRGANASTVDKDGKSAMQLALDSGLNDGELYALLRESR